MLTIKPDNYQQSAALGIFASGIHPPFSDWIRPPLAVHGNAVCIANLGFDLLDDYAQMEPISSKKKKKIAYRSIDSEWESTKK